MKREVTSAESAEFVQDVDWDVKPPVKVELDPRQLRAGIAALAIVPPPSSPSSSTSGEAGAPGPSNWGVHSVPLNRILEGNLGPADPPRRRGRHTGSKTRPRVAFNLDTLPERVKELKAEEHLAGMTSSRQV